MTALGDEAPRGNNKFRSEQDGRSARIGLTKMMIRHGEIGNQRDYFGRGEEAGREKFFFFFL